MLLNIFIYNKNILFSYIKIFSNLLEKKVLRNKNLFLLENTILIFASSIGSAWRKKQVSETVFEE
jgi:hypothetical protein